MLITSQLDLHQNGARILYTTVHCTVLYTSFVYLSVAEKLTCLGCQRRWVADIKWCRHVCIFGSQYQLGRKSTSMGIWKLYATHCKLLQMSHFVLFCT